MVYGILFQLLRLQVLGEPVPIKDNHLVKYLIPVPVTLCPLFDYVPTGKIEHFFQCGVAGEYTFCFRHLSVLAVEPLYDIRGIHDAPDIIRELEERVSVSLIGGDDITLLVLFIAKERVQFRFHKFRQDILETVPQQTVDISYAF